MNQFVYQKPKEISFSTVGADGFTFPIGNKNVEIDFVDSKTGHGRKVVSDSLTHFYYILEGSGEFIIDDQSYKCSSCELVKIPPNHTLDYKGKMKMILIIEPPYALEKVRKVD